jgi:hypothetical protein
MKLHVKILGVMYSAFGGLLGFFTLLLVLMQALTSLGVMKDDGKSPGMWGALSIGVLLMTVALWFFQTGQGLWNFNAGSRLWGLVVGGILLFALNLILMYTNDPPRTAKIGMTVFHLVCVTLGLYTLAVLGPNWGRRVFESSDK